MFRTLLLFGLLAAFIAPSPYAQSPSPRPSPPPPTPAPDVLPPYTTPRAPVPAARTATLKGHITGKAGKPLPGATNSISSPSLDQPATTTTDAHGLYQLPVPSGDGQITATYKTLTASKSFHAEENQTLTLNLKLKPPSTAP